MAVLSIKPDAGASLQLRVREDSTIAIFPPCPGKLASAPLDLATYVALGGYG